MDRRRVLVVSHLIPLVVSLVLAAEKPAFGGLMYDLVGRERLFGASALRFLAGSLIRVIGAIGGGYVIDTLGIGPNYVLIGLAHAAAAGCVLRLRPPVQAPAP